MSYSWLKRAMLFLLVTMIMSLCTESYSYEPASLLTGPPPKFESVEQLREYLYALNNYWKHMETMLRTR